MERRFSRTQKLLVGLVAGAGFCAWAGAYIYDEFKPRYVSVSGTITAVDPAAGTASLRFVHPKSGKTMDLSGKIGPDCQILVGGVPGDISSLKPGAAASVEATVRGGAGVTATRIAVESPSSASRPASAPGSDGGA
jgi:hypothetical protein